MQSCTNCGQELVGKFCHACGQKKFTLADLAVGKFFSSAIKDFTHFDFKLFKDLPALIFKPGYLTKEFILGRVAGHIKPITMFLWLNVFFFFFAYKNVLPQYKFQAANIYVKGLKEQSYEKAKALSIPQETFIEHFNSKLEQFEKYLFFFIIPLYGFVIFLFYISRKENYYVKHFVYSVHFWCYFFIYFAIVPWLINILNALTKLISGSLLIPRYDGLVFVSVMVIGSLLYHLFALKRVFEEAWWLTIIKAILLSALVPLFYQISLWCVYKLAYIFTN